MQGNPVLKISPFSTRRIQYDMSPVQGFVGVTIARYVWGNSVIKRFSLPILGVLRGLVARYVVFVLLEKPANKGRKPEFPNKPITENSTKTVLPKIQNKPKCDTFMHKVW